MEYHIKLSLQSVLNINFIARKYDLMASWFTFFKVNS